MLLTRALVSDGDAPSSNYCASNTAIGSCGVFAVFVPLATWHWCFCHCATILAAKSADTTETSRLFVARIGHEPYALTLCRDYRQVEKQIRVKSCLLNLVAMMKVR